MRSVPCRFLLAAAVGFVLGACGAPEDEKPKQQEVILNVGTADLQGKPVEMVRFYINGKKFGITDGEGTFKGRFPAKDGETLSFNVEAPPGYSVPPNVDQSRWQVKIKYPEDGRPLQVDFKATLQRPERDYLFMVRTTDPATPVKVNGELVGKTGPTGDGLLRVGGVPGTRFSARAGNITFQGTFAEDDEVYLLSETKSGPIGGTTPTVEAAAAPAEAPASVEAPASAEAEAVAAAEPPPPTPPPAEVVRDEPPPMRDDPPPVVAARPAREPMGDVWAAPAPARQERAAPPPAREPELLLGGDEPAAPAEPDPPPIALRGDDPSPPTLDLLGDEPAAPKAPPPRTPPPPTEGPDGLLVDGGGKVDDRALSGRPAAAGGGPSPVGMSREEIQERLDNIKGGLDRSKVLQRSDVEFLAQIDRTHPGYFEAHRLLADFYFELKDYRRQAEELEIATSKGKYKRDPTILLSLAKSYGRQSNYRKALSVMGRVEVNMRALPPDLKADTYRFYAEMYEFEFQRQYDDDPKKANVTLLDKALQQWEHYQTFSRGADPGGVATADARIKKLKELKSGLEL